MSYTILGPISPGRLSELRERAKQKFKVLTKTEKLESKYCTVGEHEVDEQLYVCQNCRRTFCEQHGDEKKSLCNDCILKYA
jgi:transposase-like protein